MKNIPAHMKFIKMNDDKQFHCEDGPALVYNSGTQMYFINNDLHRVCGPAIEYATTGRREFYIGGVDVTARVTKYAEEWKVDIASMEDSDYHFMWLTLGLRYDDTGKPVFDK